MTKHGWLRCAKEGTQPQVLVSLVGRSLLHISQTSESVIVALGLVIDAEGMTGLRYACAHEQIYCLDPACEDRLDSIYRARTNRAADAVIATVSLFNTVDDEMTEATTLPALRESVRGTDKRLSQPRSRGPLMASIPRDGYNTAEATNNYNATHEGELSSIPTATTAELQPNGHDTHKTEAGPPAGTGRDGAKAKESFPAKVKRIWLAKTGIDQRTYMQMFKGALAPTIAISAYQSTAWAETYTTIGYLCGIIAILSLPIQPRAKYLQTMLTNVLVCCFGCAVALLAMYCTVQARLNSEFQQTRNGGPGTSGLAAGGAPTTTYNSSASAVAGVWLFIQIYAISTYRANRPQFTIPSIMYAIFANVSMV
ncbi:hypothetical protein B0A54_06295 [Friedmanniomyces endolithicus]|uniref:Putative ER transporter 6TM N-terminal domain-containing protein n=1 Tax=Friedmanniomyces endolithicus TaxID=329885 RepID=A0A4U0UZD2_9PEZI|nr:hypothetical protein B0A54_06295 [Friedmanniomyces endolithicus]